MELQGVAFGHALSRACQTILPTRRTAPAQDSLAAKILVPAHEEGLVRPTLLADAFELRGSKKARLV